MYQQLAKLHQQSESQREDDIIVYRGQLMNNIEARNLKSKINSLFSISTFFSTSLDQRIALEYITERSRDNHQGVLFTIRLKASSAAKPFAQIGNISSFPTENEVLLSLGSVFRIDNVNMMEDNILNIQMALSEEQDKEINAVIDHLKAHIGESSSLLTFGGFLLDRGQYEDVEHFCTIMEASLPNNDPDLAVVYNSWGGVYHWYGDYETALQYYIEAYRINELHLETASVDSVATTDSNIGTIHFKMRDFSSAVNYFNHALEFRLEDKNVDYALVVKLYSQISLAYAELGDREQAQTFIGKATDTAAAENVPKKHPSYGWLKMSQAILLSKTPQTAQCITFFDEALVSFDASLTTYHPDLIIIELAFGDFYQYHGERSNALLHFKKAFDICSKALPNGHPDIEMCQRKYKLAAKNL